MPIGGQYSWQFSADEEAFADFAFAEASQTRKVSQKFVR